jgi:hypothetical protein
MPILGSAARCCFILNPLSFYTFSTFVALAQKVRDAPNDSAAVFDDKRIAEAWILAQSKSLPDGNFVIGARFALHEYPASGAIRLRPHRLVSINESYRTKLGTLLPSSCEHLACQLHACWYRCEPAFPILYCGPVNSKLATSFRLRVLKYFSPIFEFPHIHQRHPHFFDFCVRSAALTPSLRIEKNSIDARTVGSHCYPDGLEQFIKIAACFKGARPTPH